ncbi:MAG: ribonuclease P protein component [Nitrospirae bacterium]|nr:ribonuclease P protein component [Nitrospirota bacterium]
MCGDIPRPTADRAFFLRVSADIERVKRVGRRRQTPLFNLVSCPSSLPHSRIGIIVGKRLGTAVCRNRAKRLFRELARQVRGELTSAHDVLVFPRRAVLDLSSATLQKVWLDALRHEGLLREKGPSL